MCVDCGLILHRPEEYVKIRWGSTELNSTSAIDHVGIAYV